MWRGLLIYHRCCCRIWILGCDLMKSGMHESFLVTFIFWTWAEKFVVVEFKQNMMTSSLVKTGFWDDETPGHGMLSRLLMPPWSWASYSQKTNGGTNHFIQSKIRLKDPAYWNKMVTRKIGIRVFICFLLDVSFVFFSTKLDEPKMVFIHH